MSASLATEGLNGLSRVHHRMSQPPWVHWQSPGARTGSLPGGPNQAGGYCHLTAFLAVAPGSGPVLRKAGSMFWRMLGMAGVAAAAGLSITRVFQWPYWAYHVLVVSVGIVLYLASNFLMAGYIRKRAPEFASKEEAFPGVQKWELTAGIGIVPKWVSFLGLISVAFFLACPFELVARLLRTVLK